MPNLTSSIGTSNGGIPLINQASIGKAAGLHMHFPTMAAWTAAMTNERANVSGGSPTWSDGQPMSISGEPSTIHRVWSTSLNHARSVVLSSGKIVIMPQDVNIVGSGVPGGRTGNNGDLSIDDTNNAYYTLTTGSWVNSGTISTFTSSGSLVPTTFSFVVPLDLTAGREMGLYVMNGNATLGIASNPVFNGTANFSLQFGTGTLDYSAYTFKGPDTPGATTGIYDLVALYRNTGTKPYLYCNLATPSSAPLPVPGQVTGVSLVGTSLTWNATSTATSYTVEKSTDGSTGWTLAGSPTSNAFTVSGATGYYRVSAVNASGTGTPSSSTLYTASSGGTISATVLGHNYDSTQVSGSPVIDLGNATDMILPGHGDGAGTVGAASDYKMTGGTGLQFPVAFGFTNNLGNNFTYGTYAGFTSRNFDFPVGVTVGPADHIDVAAYLGGGSGAQSYRITTVSSSSPRKMIVVFGFDGSDPSLARTQCTIRCSMSDGTTIADIPITGEGNTSRQGWIYQFNFTPSTTVTCSVEFFFNDSTNKSPMFGPSVIALVP